MRKIKFRVKYLGKKDFTVLHQLQKGDVLLISEFSRSGQSTLEIMEIILFAIDKEIRMYTVKGNWQLDDTIQSKIMTMVFAMAAEIERDLISQSAKEALRVKKANDMVLGRPRGSGKVNWIFTKSKLKHYFKMVQHKVLLPIATV